MLKTKIPEVVSLILIVALLVPVLLAVPVSAATLVLTGNADLVGNAIFYLYDDGFMDIQGSGILTNYSSASAQPWYSQRASISSVSFSEGITEIGTRTFFSCSVSSVSFPSTLTKIGTHSFRECPLTSVVLPSSLETIGGYVFYGCQSLTDVYFTSVTPPVLLQDNIYPFYSCPNLVNMYVPEGSLADYVASFPSSYHAYLKEGSPPADAPTTPELYTSFTGQHIYLDSDTDYADLYIRASNVNGTLTCQYYINDVLYDEVFTFVEVSDGEWLQVWRYTPVGDGVRKIYAIVTNTVNGQSTSVQSGVGWVYVGETSGGGSGGESGGDDSEIVGKLDSLEQDMSNLQSSVDSLGNKVDGIQGTVNDMAENVENLPDDIQNGMQNVIDQEHDKTHSGGSEFVEQLEQLVPNDSEGFVTSMGSLVSSLSYDGTACVLPVPALTLPAIDGLFPSYTVMEAQEIDFEAFFHMMPENILLLVQSLCTIALIIYCFKELYDTIAYFFTLKKGDKE